MVYIRLLLLMGQRRDEIAGMRWDELDLEAATWRLPVVRAKGKREHLFPLPATAVRLLRSMRADQGQSIRVPWSPPRRTDVVG